MRFGAFDDDFTGRFQFVDAVRALGVIFEEGTIANKTWENAIVKTRDAINKASEFKLSFAARAEVAKTQACAYAYYITHIALMPRSLIRRLSTDIGALT